MAFINAIFASTQGGDKIILNMPYCFKHETAIMMASCHSVLVANYNSCQFCLDTIKKAIFNKTAQLLLLFFLTILAGAVCHKSVLRKYNKVFSFDFIIFLMKPMNIVPTIRLNIFPWVNYLVVNLIRFSYIVFLRYMGFLVYVLVIY